MTSMTSVRSSVALIVAAMVATIGISSCSETSTDGDHAATTSPVPTAPGRQLVAPDADTYEVDGGTAALDCQGRGPMPVILIGSPDDSGEDWDTIVDNLGQGVLVCRFASSTGEGEGPATPTSEADALSQALEASELPGPYVVVGNSASAPSVRSFGQRHPDQLAATLVLDAADLGAPRRVSNEIIRLVDQAT